MTGEKFKSMREAMGLSQREAAAACGVTVAAVSLWERKKSVPAHASGWMQDQWSLAMKCAVRFGGFKKAVPMPETINDAIFFMREQFIMEVSWPAMRMGAVLASLRNGLEICMVSIALYREWLIKENLPDTVRRRGEWMENASWRR